MKFLFTKAIPLIAIIFLSCSDDDPRKKYPRNVSIQYKVTTTTSGLTANISYTNSTGGESDTGFIPLPFSTNFSKKVEFGELLILSAITNDPGQIQLEIIINNNSVKKQTFQSASFVTGTIIYQFD
ncbi:MAG: hypothetical protein QXW79_05130 [Thermoplasmata archaeon]